ncbi:3-ketosteroid-9-alpha-monooxygenase, oxygenase component [BD1-7 clade bacterium]|uniref:cholesterol 7-desaturase n=1 Tax=BD1-7 clade bacterium TaxID=2029982 RepID=A0A5S9QJ35_9GAMM|nr:3-ketosteroid-9-alpha-monooxygenase, oxygenase component [BD1-7 clade bacterium]CAA0117673.1 3-ketosteroid-9-alpha-monooxygenase, oxygenase component [BD1-7 clade bacterium]
MHSINASNGTEEIQHFDNYKDGYKLPRNPNGWYAACLSKELKEAEVKPLSFFGEELVAFRDAQGKAKVVGAYCPHMGAHLGHGGTVVDGKIQCPFHGWQFDGTGACAAAPFAKRTPQSARSNLDSYITEEVNGVVLVWHHVQGKEPDYHVPEIPEMDLKQWMPMQHFTLTFRTHVQEIRENFCDESHFAFIHEQEGPADITWNPEGPLAHHHSHLTWKYFVKMGLTDEKYRFTCDSVFYGPGVLVSRTRGPIDSATIGLCTPIDDEYTQFTLMGTSRKVFPGLNWFNRMSLMKTAKRDVLLEGEIWSHKKPLEKPIYQAHERSMSKFQKWYAQFYDGHSQQETIPLRVVNS